MEDQHSLLRPFLPISASAATTTTVAATSSSPSPLHRTNTCYAKDSSSSNRSVVIRLLLVFSVAAISLWANYEASKTFEITLINDAGDTPAGRRFALFYIIDDRASRILLNTSSFVQHLLYDPDSHQYPRKHVGHVTLRLASRNLNASAIVSAGSLHRGGGRKVNGYVIDLSPSLLEEANYKEAVVPVVLRAMVRVWLWDCESTAPARLIDGVVEYVAEVAGFYCGEFADAGEGSPECEDDDWWEDKDPRTVARFLHFCEAYREGFIRRLNQAMRDPWHDRMVDTVLGIPACKLCGLHNASSWAPQNSTMLLGSM